MFQGELFLKGSLITLSMSQRFLGLESDPALHLISTSLIFFQNDRWHYMVLNAVSDYSVLLEVLAEVYDGEHHICIRSHPSVSF